MSERFAGISPAATRGLVMKEGGVDLASGVLVTTPLVSDSFCDCQGETTGEGLAAAKIELSPTLPDEW